jgi:hypothetical protein
MENMEKWNALAKPPQDALKEITGGRLAGKTDINPQWRYQAMTEQYGPCGTGWKYEIEKLWREEGVNEVFAFAMVKVYVKVEGEWSSPIPGIGGSMLVVQEKKGPYNNDEAYKMAVTDALSVALKMLGVASEIYRGNYDGTKYKENPIIETPLPTENDTPLITEAQLNQLSAACAVHGVKRKYLTSWAQDEFWNRDRTKTIRNLPADKMQMVLLAIANKGSEINSCGEFNEKVV